MGDLIELLIWLFRLLFGEAEQPGDGTGSQFPGPETQRRPRRGPYAYGDELPGQGKTLEQILEEVRQAAAQKRSQTAGLPSPEARPTPPYTSRPRPHPAASAGQRASAGRQPAAAGRVEPALAVPAPEELVSLQVAVPSIKDSLAVMPPAPEPGSVTAAPAGAEPLAPVSVVREIMSPSEAAAEVAKSAAARSTALPAGIAGMLNAILQAAPEQKRDAARQAIVLHEVFGPPRCRRPYRAGCKVF